MAMNFPTGTLVGLGGIAVSPRRLRVLRPDRVAEIAESMQANGLLQPIVLRTGEDNGFWLVAGRHRFEAAKLLKWDRIQATIYEGMDTDRAELAEIDENLIRAELSPIERARKATEFGSLFHHKPAIPPGNPCDSHDYGPSALRHGVVCRELR